MDSNNINTELFFHLYNNIDTIPSSIGDRLADDFFLKCDIKKISEMSYICEFVIPKFFHHYFSLKASVKAYDEYYVFTLDVNLDKFVGVLDTIVKYLNEKVDIKIENGEWKVYCNHN